MVDEIWGPIGPQIVRCDVFLDGRWLRRWGRFGGRGHGIDFLATASPEHASTKEHDREAEADDQHADAVGELQR